MVSEKTLANIMLFSIIFASSTFLIETIKKFEKNNRILYYVLSAILSIIFTYAVNIDFNILWISNEVFLEKIVRFIICYIISALIISIYNLFKNSKKSFDEYLIHISSNIGKSCVIYVILAIGIAIVSAIFIFLILDGKNYYFILRLEVLLFGLYYIPRILYSLDDIENEVGKFVKIVIKYVLNSLVIIAFIIIYLYIVKIFIQRNMPSNQIYRIIASLFVIGCPIWTMANYFEKKIWLDKIISKLPILFTPFILLQIYTIGIRIINYGFTEARYLCVMLIVFEIIYTIFYLKNKEKNGKILLVFVALLLISVIAPYVNMYKISVISQYNYLKIYKEKISYTQQEKEKIKGAYNYLRYSREGKVLIDKLLTQKDKENINNFNTNQQIEEIYKEEYIYANEEVENINIEGYKTLNIVSVNNYDEINLNSAFNTIEINSKIYLDLSVIMKKYILNKDEISSYFRKNCEIVLNENQKIILTHIYINYDELKQTVNSYSIDGYLLEK